MIQSPVDKSPLPQFVKREIELFSSPEPRLYREFVQLVGSLVFDEIAIPYHRRTLTNLSDYQLVPVLPTIVRKSSMDKSRHQNKTLRGIRTTYPIDPDGRPHLDTRQAIGLARNNHLLAVASAGVISTKQKNILRIVQLQNVSGFTYKQPDEYKEAFTQDGLDWKKTLVRAWEEVGHVIGVNEFSIETWQNNFCLKTNPERGKAVLDDVAHQMGYTQLAPDADWFKPVSEISPTERKSIGLPQHLGALMLSIR